MIIFKKYFEGLAIIDDSTGEKRLLKPFEVELVKSEFKTLGESAVNSYYIDTLPDRLKKLAIFTER